MSTDLKNTYTLIANFWCENIPSGNPDSQLMNILWDLVSWKSDLDQFATLGLEGNFAAE
jgi:hypothetical protein